MHLIHKEARALAVLGGALLRLGHGLANLLDAGEYGVERNEVRAGGIGNDLRQRRLARAGWPIEDEAAQLIGLNGATQQPPGTNDVLLADVFLEGARAHARRQRRILLQPFLVGLLKEIHVYAPCAADARILDESAAPVVTTQIRSAPIANVHAGQVRECRAGRLNLPTLCSRVGSLNERVPMNVVVRQVQTDLLGRANWLPSPINPCLRLCGAGNGNFDNLKVLKPTIAKVDCALCFAAFAKGDQRCPRAAGHTVRHRIILLLRMKRGSLRKATACGGGGLNRSAGDNNDEQGHKQGQNARPRLDGFHFASWVMSRSARNSGDVVGRVPAQ